MLGKVRFMHRSGLQAAPRRSGTGRASVQLAARPIPHSASSYQSSTTRQNTSSDDARVTFALERAAIDDDARPLRHRTNAALSTRRRATRWAVTPLPSRSRATTSTRESRLQASLRQVRAQRPRSALVYGIDLARGDARIDAGDGANRNARLRANGGIRARQPQHRHAASLYAGMRAERDGGQGGAIAPSIGCIAPLSPAAGAARELRGRLPRPDRGRFILPGIFQPEPAARAHAKLRCDADRFALAGDDVAHVLHAGRQQPHHRQQRNYDYSAPPGPGNEPVINAQHASIAGFTLAVQTAALRTA